MSDGSITKLVERLKERQVWCLVAPSGLCYLGPDPLVLAAQATYKPPGFGEGPASAWAVATAEAAETADRR